MMKEYICDNCGHIGEYDTILPAKTIKCRSCSRRGHLRKPTLAEHTRNCEMCRALGYGEIEA